MKKRKNRFYTAEFKQEAIALVTEQGYSIPKAAASLGSTDKLLYNWKAKFDAERSGSSLNSDERAELLRTYPNRFLFQTMTPQAKCSIAS
ncbi:MULTISPECIES: transposase [Morganellaceae]|uniref:Transposase n=2 Tax=Providencia stuartii TaxID=588 RepID=A0AA86YUC1_PROST|nr:MULTISPECIES: transposase [Morganellaceae]EDU57788.1 transposase [Providencia stuartii ATCC 25827]MCR4082010.1 transposase [Providencia stuartii]MDN7224977.1 transposase [Providencia stuartii]MTC80904.1 transposase [Providencia stuartii]NBN38939.1 transposase [Proteus sp. G2638]